MYCTRCGKKIDYDLFVCNECLAKEAELTNQTQNVSEPVVEANAEAVTTATIEAAEPVQEEVKTENANTAQSKQYYYSAPNYTYAAYQSQTITQQAPKAPGNPRMIGFGKSLASLILSEIGSIFSFIALIAASEDAFSGAILLIMTLGMVIPALVFGIKSITTSSRVAAQNLPRPILTLVFGIIGTATSAFALFYCFLTFMMLGLA